MLHLAGGVALGVDVGDLLELERALEGDGVVDAAAEEEEIARGGEELGELAAVVVEGEARAGAAVWEGDGRGGALGGADERRQ